MSDECKFDSKWLRVYVWRMGKSYWCVYAWAEGKVAQVRFYVAHWCIQFAIGKYA